MSAAAIVSSVLEISALIAKWIDEGLSNEEIRRRLADPSIVGDRILDGIRERRQIGRDLLGRDPR